MNVKIVGHISNHRQGLWYQLSDGSFASFHVAYTDTEHEQTVMIVADENTWPSIAAEQQGIYPKFMRNATTDEVAAFLVEAEISLKETK